MHIIFILVHFQVYVFHLRDCGKLNIAVYYLQLLSSGRTYFATPWIWSSLRIASVSGRWQKPQRVSSKARTSITLQLLPLHFWGRSPKSARQWGSLQQKNTCRKSPDNSAVLTELRQTSISWANSTELGRKTSQVTCTVHR